MCLCEWLKVLIFSQMTQMMDILEDYCWLRQHSYCRLDGTMKMSDRHDEVWTGSLSLNKFQRLCLNSEPNSPFCVLPDELLAAENDSFQTTNRPVYKINQHCTWDYFSSQKCIKMCHFNVDYKKLWGLGPWELGPTSAPCSRPLVSPSL